MLRRVVAGKRNAHLTPLARADALQLVLEAGYQPAGADLGQVAARLAALEGLAADRSAEVHDHEVALPRLPLHGLERGHRLAQPLELGLDLLGIDRWFAPADLNTPPVPELGRRAHPDLDRERERGAPLGQVAEVELGVADGGQAGVVQGLLVPARKRATDGFVENGITPDLLDHDLRRDLALAKAGHAHLAADGAGGRPELMLEGLGRYLHIHADTRLAELGGGRLDHSGHAAVTIA